MWVANWSCMTILRPYGTIRLSSKFNIVNL